MSGSGEKIECKYFKQAISNENFLLSIERSFSKDFFDWKTTVAFYSALHYIKSYALTKGVVLSDHSDTFKKLYSQQGKSPTLKIDSKIVSCYRNLFRLAHSSRYDGYTKPDVCGKIGKLRFKDAKEYLELVKHWIVPKLEKANINTKMESIQEN